ncbi:C39 family peptidase [Anaerobacterium chartisolvens]|uniref:C39 family peptidase n=1 Tax=Anaerobacterium chartisolvens TaxID=1297424 RepID=UPI000DF2CC73|nr:C39 family peptidase [Anaerobacterium chartisolvens]
MTDTDSLYPGDNSNNCSLTALATIFEYHKNYGGCSSLPSGFTAIYKDIHTIAKDKGWWTSSGGTDPTYIDDIATAMFKKYNYTNGRGNNDYVLDWNVAKSQIDQGRPFVFNMANDYYANHSVCVFAYCAYKKSGKSDVCFLKVADGWSTGSRYIDWNQFVGFGSWTKVLPY